AKKTENMLLYQNEHDNISADIRQAYRAIDSAKLKMSVLQQSVSTGEKVNNLYIEQFKGGKRTLFELLDAQAVLYAAKRDYLSSQYEDIRARLILLRSLGRLAKTLAG
ncbi:MAG: TolC family protein, partial [Pseudomonadota bacterium]